MKKRGALILVLLIVFLIAGNYLFFKADEIFPDREIVVVARVIDGDTVELADGRTIRLLNINTPEKGRAFSKEATDFLKEFEGESVELESEGFGKYGRVLGRLYGDGYINLEIVKLGLAHQYLGEKSELGDFKDAEDLARASELGLWKKSEYYGCLDVEINKKDEYVSITNGCAVDFKGWTVKDESTRNYVFPDVGSNVVLYSGEGVDAEGNLYWGRGKIWNDDKDSIFIRDDLGFLVYYSSYGY